MIFFAAKVIKRPEQEVALDLEMNIVPLLLSKSVHRIPEKETIIIPCPSRCTDENPFPSKWIPLLKFLRLICQRLPRMEEQE